MKQSHSSSGSHPLLHLPKGVERRTNLQSVVTCEEAAISKAIPLTNELKSLFLSTSVGYVLAHTTGDRLIKLRLIKQLLGVDQAHLASLAELASFGMEPGTVCPFLETTLDLVSIIDKPLLQLDRVSTNDGTRYGALFFSPVMLLGNPHARIAEFSV